MIAPKTSSSPPISVETAIKGRILRKGRGACISSVDFADLGSSEAIRIALHRLSKKGVLRRVMHGLYEYPRHHDRLGVLPPKIENVVAAIAKKDRIRTLPSGALMANLLGLSEQVPAKAIFMTDGASRSFDLGKTKIVFRKTTPKNMAAANTVSGKVFQALKYLGKDNVTAEVITKLKTRLRPEDLNQITRDAHIAPIWLRKIIQKELKG